MLQMLSNNLFIPINEPCTDSLSLSIPESSIKVLDEALTSRTKTFYVDIGQDGLVDDFEDYMPPKPYKLTTECGISVRFLWVNIPNKKTGLIERFLNITISAKLLGSRYFEGITLDNVHVAYKFILNIGAFYIDFRDFLDGTISDIDICINHRLSPANFHTSLKRLESLVMPGKNRFLNLICKRSRFGAFLNVGMDFNERKKAKPATPYFKLYHKELELLNNSAAFYMKYLFGANIKNLVRSEFTIKSYKHKQRLANLVGFPPFKTLHDFLQIPKSFLKKAHDTGLPSYLMKKIRKYTKSSLKPLDHLICHCMTIAIDNGGDIDQIKMILNEYEGEKKAMQKSRLKSKINELWNHLKNDDLSIENTSKINAEINEFLYSGLQLSKIS